MVFNYHWNREEQQKYAEHRLFRFLRNFVQSFHPHYGQVFQEAALDPRQMNSYEDFRRIPLTTLADLAADPCAFVLQKGASSTFKPTPAMRLRQMASSAGGVVAGFRPDSLGERRGIKQKLAERSFAEWQPIHYQWLATEGQPLPIAYTLRDMQSPVSRIAAMLFMTGYQPGMRLLNLLPCSSQGYLQLLAAQWLVRPAVSALHVLDGADSLQAQAGVLNPQGCELILGETAALGAWLDASATDKAQGEAGMDSLQKVLVTSGLDGAARLEMKKKLAQAGAGDAELLQGYGRPEMRALFFECAEGTGIHLNPEFFFWELLDPESREPVKWGEPGVLTFSHFDWRGTVLLRYWTGDLVEGGLYWERCRSCGMIMPLAHTPIAVSAAPASGDEVQA